MNGHIPNIVAPYPDELLYSWIRRLAKANGLSVEVFFRTYFGEGNLAKDKIIPIDPRRGFLDFCEALNCDMDNMDLYFQLSTTQFELSFYPPKLQTRILHNIIRPESKLNPANPYFITKPHICLECMKEDVEQYGEFFLHRSHHLPGATACHKHGTPLYEVHRLQGHKYVYDFENPVLLTDQIIEQDVEYAKYAHYLLSSDIMSESDEILKLILNKMNPQGNLSRKQVAENISKILNNPTKKNKWTRQDVIFPPEDTIRILMCLYPNPEDFLANLKRCNLVIKKHCKKCNKDYYTTQYADDMGWGCIYCDSKSSDQKLFERLVRIGGNNEYELKTPFQNMSEKVTLHHKICDKDISISPSHFLFLHTRCNCSQRLLRKEAEKRMKPYPDFELLEFKGAGLPATFRHKVCGEIFELNAFRDFIETPKCRCCETQQDITQEEFEKRVKDLVGEEYTVVGEIVTLKDRVAMRHNSCGHIHEFKPYEFLSGTRCPQCYQKTSHKKLEVMLKEYANDRYSIIGHDNYRFILRDNKTDTEIKLKGCHIVQELLRPTPSPILPNDKTKSIGQSLSTWDRWYKLCVEYKNEFGHVCPAHTEKYKDQAFGDWCSAQRIAFNKGHLSEDKIKRLEDVGFIFNYALYAWNQRFEEYKAYVQETSDMNPFERIVHNGNKVGKWVRNQRHEEAKGKLNPVYKEILLEFNPDFFKPRQIRKKK